MVWITGGWCEREDIKERMLINDADTTYDTSVDRAGVEAKVMVEAYLVYFTTGLDAADFNNPANWVDESTTPDAIEQVVADLAASIFKRRMFPQETKIRGEFLPPHDANAEVDATGWWASGWKKLNLFVKATYIKPKIAVIQSDPEFPDAMFGYKEWTA